MSHLHTHTLAPTNKNRVVFLLAIEHAACYNSLVNASSARPITVLFEACLFLKSPARIKTTQTRGKSQPAPHNTHVCVYKCYDMMAFQMCAARRRSRRVGVVAAAAARCAYAAHFQRKLFYVFPDHAGEESKIVVYMTKLLAHTIFGPNAPRNGNRHQVYSYSYVSVCRMLCWKFGTHV